MALVWQAKSLKDFTRLELVRPEQAQDLGGGTFRAEVRFGDQVPGYSDTRSLWDISQLAFREGDECAFGIEINLPSDWIGWFPKNDELASWPARGIHGGSFLEFHHAPNDGNWAALRPGSAPFYLWATDKSFNAYLLETDPTSANFGGLRADHTWTLAPIARGTWQSFVVHYGFSTDPAKGFVEILADGKTVVPRTAAGTLYPNTFCYPQVGIYRRGFIGDPSLKWASGASTGIVYPAGFFPATGSRVFPKDDGYPQSVQFRNLRIGRTVGDVMATPTTTGATTPSGGTATPAPTPAAPEWLWKEIGGDLDAQVAAAQAEVDAATQRRDALAKIRDRLSAQLRKGPQWLVP